jgi:hypothetical protein
MDSRKYHSAPPCPTLLRPAGGPLLKRPEGCFRGGPPKGWAACGRLLPLWTPHAIRLRITTFRSELKCVRNGSQLGQCFRVSPCGRGRPSLACPFGRAWGGHPQGVLTFQFFPQINKFRPPGLPASSALVTLPGRLFPALIGVGLAPGITVAVDDLEQTETRTFTMTQSSRLERAEYISADQTDTTADQTDTTADQIDSADRKSGKQMKTLRESFASELKLGEEEQVAGSRIGRQTTAPRPPEPSFHGTQLTRGGKVFTYKTFHEG